MNNTQHSIMKNDFDIGGELDQSSSYTNFVFLREINENNTESCSIQSASDLKILLPTGSLFPIKIEFYDFISIFSNPPYSVWRISGS